MKGAKNNYISDRIILLILVLCSQLLTSCNEFRTSNTKKECILNNKTPPANIGDTITFTFLVKDIENNGFHYDTDGAPIYFNLLKVNTLKPKAWKDEEFHILYRGEPKTNNIVLKINDTFTFSHKITRCFYDKFLWL